MDPIWRSTLVEAGCTIVEVPPYADVATICAASGPHIDGMICRMPGPEGITAAVMDASPNLRVIARHGTGVDSVDLVAARERGVIVTHTGAANDNAVSEFTSAAIHVSLIIFSKYCMTEYLTNYNNNKYITKTHTQQQQTVADTPAGRERAAAA